MAQEVVGELQEVRAVRGFERVETSIVDCDSSIRQRLDPLCVVAGEARRIGTPTRSPPAAIARTVSTGVTVGGNPPPRPSPGQPTSSSSSSFSEQFCVKK
jgi:hypothetical protein